jgi:glycosyltransferase involved in cell wall biosynthesis
LPLVALEAMACGLPVIATNVGGIKEILLSEHGKLVPPNEPELLAKAVLEFIPNNFASIKSKVRTSVEERYSWDINVDRLAQLYEELI